MSEIFTFGHSTLSYNEADELLADVDLLVDVRSHPGSKAQPQWNKEAVEGNYPYLWLPGLGGWSEKVALISQERELAESRGVNVEGYLGGYFPKGQIAKKFKTRPALSTGDPEAPYWNSGGLYEYQFWMTTEAFRKDIEILLGRKGVCAIFCAEAVWWRCHRSMIADALEWQGIPVYHFQPRFTRHLEAIGNRWERYEPEVTSTWTNWWGTHVQ